LWVTIGLVAKYAGQRRFRMCTKVFSNISFAEIFKDCSLRAD
jgi:hypothetical protein